MEVRVGSRYKIALLVAVPAVCGCAHREQAEVRLAARERSIASVMDAIAESEAKRPARLRAAREYIGDEVGRVSDSLERNLGLVEQFIADDFERWETRQPQYAEELRRIFAGKPERIEPTFIDLFY
jgi:hypothetical protein